MDRFTLLGLFAVTSMLIGFALKKQNRRQALAFARACLPASAWDRGR